MSTNMRSKRFVSLYTHSQLVQNSQTYNVNVFEVAFWVGEPPQDSLGKNNMLSVVVAETQQETVPYSRLPL